VSHVFKSEAFLPGSHFKSFGPTLRKFKYLLQRQESEEDEEEGRMQYMA
jgi:hypothetical protein